MIQYWLDANMLKGGIAYANKVTTVSNTYAWEIQTEEYGEELAEHLRYVFLKKMKHAYNICRINK